MEPAKRQAYLGKVCRNTLILFILAISSPADDQQAIRVYQEGQKAERSGDLLRAYMLYARAAALDPSNLAIAAHRNQAGNLAIRSVQIHDVATEPDPEAAFFQMIQSLGAGQTDVFGSAAMAPHLASPPAKEEFRSARRRQKRLPTGGRGVRNPNAV